MLTQNPNTIAYPYGYVERRLFPLRDEFSLCTPTIIDTLPKIVFTLPIISLAENLGLTFC